jgi:hypothetical protein
MRRWLICLTAATLAPAAAEAQSFRALGIVKDVGVLVQTPTSGIGTARQATAVQCRLRAQPLQPVAR